MKPHGEKAHSNRYKQIMKTTFWLIYIVWFAFEVVLGRIRRSNEKDQKREDKHSLLIIWLTIAIAMPLSSTVAGVIPAPIVHNAWLPWLGLSLILVGIAARFLVIRSLGKEFTVDVAIREGHKLKTNGIYSIIRHPSYSASWLSFIGYGISLNNWISLIIVSTLVLGAFLYRISVEEELLVAQFGDQYLQYRKRTKAIIPFIW
jgi:protein-S-isoprenylcysteine O-methyltransferase Ste14